MKKILNLSLGSAKRDLEEIFIVAQNEVLVKRIGLNGDTEKFISLVQTLKGFDALAVGGINSAYCFDGLTWPLNQYHKLTALTTLPVYDGAWIKRYYEPHSLKKILAAELLHNESWLVFSVLDRSACYEYLKERNIKVSIGDAYAALNLPIVLPHQLFKLAARMLLPFFAFLPVSFFYPYEQKRVNKKLPVSLQAFNVVLSETNFLSYKNFSNLNGKTLVLSRAAQQEKNDYLAKGVRAVYSLLPGEILSANIIEAMIGITLGFDGRSSESLCTVIDEIKRKTK